MGQAAKAAIYRKRNLKGSPLYGERLFLEKCKLKQQKDQTLKPIRRQKLESWMLPSVGWDVGCRALSTAGGVQPLRRVVGEYLVQFRKKHKPHGPAVPLLGINLGKIARPILKGTCMGILEHYLMCKGQIGVSRWEHW